MSERTRARGTDPWDLMVEVPLGLLLDLADREEHIIRTILRLFAHYFQFPDEPGLTVEELAEAAGLNRKRTSRALLAHQKRGWVRVSEGRWSLAVEPPHEGRTEHTRGEGPTGGGT